MNKCDAKLVCALGVDVKTAALVRVKTPMQLNVLERNFEITHRYPFIRTVGIMCGLNDAIKLERMQEVESVSAQSIVTAFEDDAADNFGTDNLEIDNLHIDIAKANDADAENVKSLAAQNHNIETYIDAVKTDAVKNGLRKVAGGMLSFDIEMTRTAAGTNGTTRNEAMKVEAAKTEAMKNGAAKNGSKKIAGEIFSSDRLDGDGVTLCIMDTGVSVHSDLEIPRKRIVHFVDMINGQEIPYDDNGHGTFVSGVAAGNGLLSGGKVCGVAPKANIIGLKVIGENGETGTFKILDGMQWLFDNASKYGIKVVCMSFGADPIPFSDPLQIGAEMLVASGITVVCAAGNSGKGNLKSPGISPDVITVGAVDDDDNVAEFSSYGVYQGVARPDLYARGVRLKGLSAGSTYSLMSGTSVSAPYVAGACCLLCQKYKNATPRQIKHMLLDSCYIKNGIKIFSLD